MPLSVGSTSQYAGNIQVQRLAQDQQKALAKLLPQPVQQTSGTDRANFSGEALARLQAEEQAATPPPDSTT